MLHLMLILWTGHLARLAAFRDCLREEAESYANDDLIGVTTRKWWIWGRFRLSVSLPLRVSFHTQPEPPPICPTSWGKRGTFVRHQRVFGQIPFSRWIRGNPDCIAKCPGNQPFADAFRKVGQSDHFRVVTPHRDLDPLQKGPGHGLKSNIKICIYGIIKLIILTVLVLGSWYESRHDALFNFHGVLMTA